MKVKCPACGAVNSLDALIGYDAASDALLAALAISGELGKSLVQYLGLFRPAQSALSFKRVAKLLNELQPMIEAGEISRDGKRYPAPVEAWVVSIQQMMQQRHQLRLPLESHGYLLEVIKGYKPTAQAAVAILQNGSGNRPLAEQSKTVVAVAEAMKWANG